MKHASLLGLVLALGLTAGALISPLIAQQQPATTCAVGENSNAVCAGNSVYFAGNTSGLDDGVWLIRINGDSGEISYRSGKKLVTLSEPK